MKHSGFSGRIGVAREDVTPPVGIFCRNWGAAKHDAATGIHRPLMLTALTLQDSESGTPLILIDSDLGWFASMDVASRFLDRLRSELDLPPENLIFAKTHTHSAPPLVNPEPEWEGGELLPAYIDQVCDSAVAVARRALESAQPAMLEWHAGRCALATNRDLREGDRIVCGYNPTVPADDALLVGRVTTAGGEILATLANYACHPTTLAWDNDQISPDYIGAMRETVERDTGGAPALFLQGASGELSPRYQYVGDTAVADQHGRQLGHAVLATLEDMNPSGHELAFDGVVESGAPLAVWKPRATEVSGVLKASVHHVNLPLKDWPSAAELTEQYEASDDRTLKERLRRKLRIRDVTGDGETYPLKLHVWRVGDAVLCGTLAESYSMIQQRLRSAFPDRSLIWMNLINGALGYLPPEDLYGEDVYQVWQTPFAAGSLEQLIDEAKQAVSAIS
jgi:hypothetical protein